MDSSCHSKEEDNNVTDGSLLASVNRSICTQLRPYADVQSKAALDDGSVSKFMPVTSDNAAARSTDNSDSIEIPVITASKQVCAPIL